MHDRLAASQSTHDVRTCRQAPSLRIISVAMAVLVAAVLVDVVRHGVLAVRGLVLVQLRLGGGDLGGAALVRQLALVVRPRRRRLGLLRHLGLRDGRLRLGRARAVLHLLLGVLHLGEVSCFG
uniref:Uncharacterized protein n=1 Tax=Triticum urartu TaxID=4572 RepID=A0A8R7QUB5_TRIUA